jgi:hypothetical protein
MAIKMRGVVAAPGEYKYGDTVEVKTEEEIRKDVKARPFVPLTYGHVQPLWDSDAETWSIPEDLIIGSVYRKWSKQDKRVNAKVNIHEEKMPASAQKTIDNGKKVSISADIFLDSVDNGIQKGIETTHIALLDGDDPVCPLEVCGLEMRQESTGRIRRLEQKTDLDAPPAEKQEEAPVEEAEAPVPDVEPVKAEPEEPKPEEAPKTEIPVEEVSDEEPEVEEEVPLEPEVVIPAAVPVVEKPFKIIDGNYVFEPFKQKQEKK